MTATLTPPAPDAPEASEAPGPSVRRTWRRRSLRFALSVAAILAIGNMVILAASGLAKVTAPDPAIQVPDDVARLRNFEAVDATLWRGGAPGRDGYRALAAAGVTTVIDLRAEDELVIPEDLLAELAVTRVAIPIRDGQTPTQSQVQQFLDIVDSNEGTVYLHCGAGVGRTGTMAAAYRVSRGNGGGFSAMRANLAVGPPSLEQLAYAIALDAGEVPQRPNVALVAVSRTFDGPRRIFKALQSL